MDKYKDFVLVHYRNDFKVEINNKLSVGIRLCFVDDEQNKHILNCFPGKSIKKEIKSEYLIIKDKKINLGNSDIIPLDYYLIHIDQRKHEEQLIKMSEDVKVIFDKYTQLFIYNNTDFFIRLLYYSPVTDNTEVLSCIPKSVKWFKLNTNEIYLNESKFVIEKEISIKIENQIPYDLDNNVLDFIQVQYYNENKKKQKNKGIDIKDEEEKFNKNIDESTSKILLENQDYDYTKKVNNIIEEPLIEEESFIEKEIINVSEQIKEFMQTPIYNYIFNDLINVKTLLEKHGYHFNCEIKKENFLLTKF